MSKDQLPEARGPAVTYSRVPPGRVEDAERVEPRLTATEIPPVSVHPHDTAVDIDPEDYLDFGVEPPAAPVRRRKRQWRGLLVLAIVAIAAVVFGVLALTGGGTRNAAPTAGTTVVSKTAADPDAEIASLKQQIETIETKAAATAEDAREKTAELRQRIDDLEASKEAAGDAATDSANGAGLASAPAMRETVPAEAAEPAPVVAAVPPLPRVRPEMKEPAVPVDAPADLAPAASTDVAPAAPPDDQNYVKSIESILAKTPSDNSASTAANPAAPVAQAAPQPSAPAVIIDNTGDTGGFDASPAKPTGPIPPEPIPDVPDNTQQ